MSSKNTLRSRKARAASRPSLALECLESRLALAVLGGNVNAQLVGSTLLLTGDALDNALVVSTATGGRMAVLGGLGTTINGVDTSVTPFVTSRPVTSIVANLNAGNDIIGFTNSAVGLVNQLTPLGIFSPFAPTLQADIDAATGGIPTFTLPGSVTVTTAAGNDAVGLIGTVGGSVAANLGSSSSVAGPGQGNGFTIGDPFVTSVANRIGGSLSVVGGNQRDAVKVYGTDVGGGVSAALGNGENFAFLFGFGSTFGSFAYTGGTGNDGVFFSDALTIRNGVSVLTGPRGEDTVDGSATSIGGSVVVNTGTGADDDYVRWRSDIRGGLSVTTGAGEDYVRFSSGSIGGGLTMNSGAGVDYVGVDTDSIGGGLAINSGEDDDYIEVFADTIGGGVAINSGAGDDFVECESTVGLNAVIDAGAGNDRFFSSGLTTRYNLFVYLGPGIDRLELYNVRASAAFLYGGTGMNTLNTNAATRTGIRTLRYFQFQSVNNF